MKFLEAKKLVDRFEGGPKLEFLLGVSGTADPLILWIRAAAAERGYTACPFTLDFNTLAQTLRAPAGSAREVFVLLPWDLHPEADWRSGLPIEASPLAGLEDSAASTLTALSRRPNAAILYVPAPMPPLGINARTASALQHRLTAMALDAGAVVLPSEIFSLDSYFRSGFAFATDRLGELARAIVVAAATGTPATAKVVVTDFDNVLWRGVVGEDGIDGVHQGPEGLGFPHFVYQTYLRALRSAGILVAGVTRNDPDLAMGPLEGGTSVLTRDDFVSVIASYHAKSSQITELATTLNLGIDAFVFVDDNPIELAEVSTALPDLHVEQFPLTVADLPAFLGRLARVFHRTSVTEEDRSRTELYRRRAAAVLPTEAEGADIFEFLRSLEMQLAIRDCTYGNRSRAVQLINKTNQFNLNGVRRSDEEVGAILGNGGRLITASLTDRHGEHGEILAFLVDPENTVRSFVLSCRAFQRRVEYAFLCWLAQRGEWTSLFEYTPTPRNEPFRRFLVEADFSAGEPHARVQQESFVQKHGQTIGLFKLVEAGRK
jgi:FkbH-like protein